MISYAERINNPDLGIPAGQEIISRFPGLRVQSGKAVGNVLRSPNQTRSAVHIYTVRVPQRDRLFIFRDLSSLWVQHADLSGVVFREPDSILVVVIPASGESIWSRSAVPRPLFGFTIDPIDVTIDGL